MRGYTQAAETYLNSADVRFAPYQVHQQSGYFDQTFDAYQRAVRDSSYEALARCNQVREAVAARQRLIALDRNNLDAYDLLSQTYQSVGAFEQASHVYKNLGKVNPGSSVARECPAHLQKLRTRSA